MAFLRRPSRNPGVRAPNKPAQEVNATKKLIPLVLLASPVSFGSPTLYANDLADLADGKVPFRLKEHLIVAEGSIMGKRKIRFLRKIPTSPKVFLPTFRKGMGEEGNLEINRVRLF